MFTRVLVSNLQTVLVVVRQCVSAKSNRGFVPDLQAVLVVVRQCVSAKSTRVCLYLMCRQSIWWVERAEGVWICQVSVAIISMCENILVQYLSYKVGT